MTKPTDDLDAVRVIVDALEGFEIDDKERIVRWALEKLKLPNLKLGHGQRPPIAEVPTTSLAATTPPIPPPGALRDLRTFVAEKQPKSDVHFAATVAFYYRFEASPDQRKESISSEDLREACRLANRERLNKPLGTLNNARTLGLLDSAGRGLFAINSVGENLVAMILPGEPGKAAKVPKKPKRQGNRRKASK